VHLIKLRAYASDSSEEEEFGVFGQHFTAALALFESSGSKEKMDKKKKKGDIVVDIDFCIVITTRTHQCRCSPIVGSSYCKLHITLFEKMLVIKNDKKSIAKNEEIVANLKLELKEEEARTSQATRDLEDRKISDMIDMLGQMDMGSSSMSQ